MLLDGPAAALDAQGKALTAAAIADGARVLSPFPGVPGASALHPRPSSSLLTLDLGVRPGVPLGRVVPRVERLIRSVVHSPVRASLSGQSVIGRATNDATVAAVHHAELIALPVLVIVLLLVFGSPVAALIPGLAGVATVLAGSGVVSLLTRLVALDANSMSLLSMMGLALGVDYSLLLVSRFRAALAGGLRSDDAAAAALASAGRTVVFAGVVLLVGMSVTLLLAPGLLLLSMATGVIVVAVLSVAVVTLVLPAALSLIGERINRWSLRGRRPVAQAGTPRLLALTRWVRRHHAAAIILSSAALLALTIAALSLRTGTTSPAMLPPGATARTDFERISRQRGPGWAGTFDVIGVPGHAVSRHAALSAYASAERAIKHSPGVLAAFGPGDLPAKARAGEPIGLRQAAGLVVGDRAGQIIVVPRTFATRNSALYPRLRRIAGALARSIGGRAGVAGTGAQLIDYDTTIAARFPLLVAALALAGFLTLVAILRAPLLALIAALANVLTVAAAFAVIALTFQGQHPLLGGAGFVDVSAVAGMFAVTFGLSMDYQVFLLARIRECRAGHTATDALDTALGDTAAVVTGAATIMTAVFAAFAAAPFVSLRQLGVGLAGAVLIDATLIRLVLFPATLELLDERAWWSPSWMRHNEQARPGDPSASGGRPIPRERATTPVTG